MTELKDCPKDTKMVKSPKGLDGCCGGEVGSFFKGLYKFSPAVGVAAVVGCVDAYEDIKGAEHFGPGKCVTQKYRIAGRYICGRDLLVVAQISPVLRYINGVGYSPLGRSCVPASAD